MNNSKTIIINQVHKEVIMLRIDEVAEMIGHKKSYVYKLTRNSKIPFSKSPNGRILFFNKAEINKWMQAVKFKAIK